MPSAKTPPRPSSAASGVLHPQASAGLEERLQLGKLPAEEILARAAAQSGCQSGHDIAMNFSKSSSQMPQLSGGKASKSKDKGKGKKGKGKAKKGKD